MVGKRVPQTVGREIYAAGLSNAVDVRTNAGCGKFPVLIAEKDMVIMHTGPLCQPILQGLLGVQGQIDGPLPRPFSTDDRSIKSYCVR